jgi:hypothetical protein
MALIQPTTSDPWLKPREAAEHASLSVDNFLKRIRNGTGPRVAGKHKLIRCRASWIDAWVTNGFKPVETEDRADINSDAE